MRQIATFRRVPGSLLPSFAVFALAFAAHSFGVFDRLDARIHDGLLRGMPASPPPAIGSLPDATVVTIDPRSLRALEAWPWPRHRYAEAIDRLERAGAVAIAFDIDFSTAAQPEHDARFSERMRESGRVALATFSQTETLPGGYALEIVNRPIPILADAAAGLGNVLVPIDADGVVRRVPRTQRIGGDEIPSLAHTALRLALAHAGDGRGDRGGDRGRRSADDAESATHPTAANAAAGRVDYRRAHPPIPTLAFSDLIEGRFDTGLLAGRVVFIGATAAEFQDLWATPIDPALPGVLIQALAYRTAAAEQVGEAVLHPASHAAVGVALGLLVALLHPGRRRVALARAALFSGTAFGVVCASWLLLWQLGLVWPVSIGLVVVSAQYALGIEGLERQVRALAEARASSLDTLARVGDLTLDVRSEGDLSARPEAGLELALRLLGDVVSARGVVMLRVDPTGRPRAERLEWRPERRDTSADATASRAHETPSLPLDEAVVARTLRQRSPIEIPDPALAGAVVVHTPLFAANEPVGILSVFCAPGQQLGSLERRTIATVAAQLALTAQNIQLIERLRETFESSIAAVASAVEARDGYTDQHCRRLAAFSSLMGTRLGMPAAEIRAMELGALLHDVGKIGIRDLILNKPGRLDPDERREMERHPEIGAGIVGPVVGLDATTLHCILHHHECWDGSGYPTGLAGVDIPLAARIVTIVDVWDALSTARPYKPAFAQDEVRDLIRKGAGTRFDPQLVELFFEVLEEQGEEMLALVARSTGQEIAS